VITVEGIGGINLPEVIVDLNLCDGDGVCVDVCPVNVFDLVDVDGEKKAQPTRSEDCIMCMACENSCPTTAIRIEG
jgi:NAD-dependent dihydropyrimidine dehydrogenase PreA subunit